MTGIEVGIAVGVGVLLGRFLPNRRKRPKPAKSPGPICGCEHHHSYHDAKSGACAHIKQSYRENGAYAQLRCTCRQYSGPVPMPEFYAPEITTGGNS